MKKILLLIIPILLIGCSFKSSKEVSLIPFMQKDKYGYFDLEGKIAINPQFSFATVFREDLALVKSTGDNGKWGYIDKKGKYVINAIYKDATVFQDGIAWVVSENSAPSAINNKGEIQFSLKDADNVKLYSEGLAAFSKVDSTGTTWGFVDKSGKQVINTQFAEVGDFYEEKCAVKNKEGKWGFIDKSGKIIINYQFDGVQNFDENKAIVYLDDKAGVINDEGKYIINPQFESISPDNENFLVVQDDKAGWCDDEAKFIINPQFESASAFGDNNLASIKSGDKYGYINEEGKIMINPQFDEATQFFEDVALVKTSDKFGLIDKEGKYIVNPQFEEIGFDLYAYLMDFTLKSSIRTDYLDVDSIFKVIKIESPEGLSFNDNFISIMRKKNMSESDFNAYSETNVLFENKKINNDVDYSFAIVGNAKSYDYSSYSYKVSNEKPVAFGYVFRLSGRAYNKSESIKESFSKKLKGFTLLKSGWIGNDKTFIYKNDNRFIILTSSGSDSIIFYILDKSYKIESYLTNLSDNPKTKVNSDSYSDNQDTYYGAVDTAAAAPIDTTGYYDE